MDRPKLIKFYCGQNLADCRLWTTERDSSARTFRVTRQEHDAADGVVPQMFQMAKVDDQAADL